MSRFPREGPNVLVGQCAACGVPAALSCTICGRTFCRQHLDEEERVCHDCLHAQRNPKSAVEHRPPPSRKLRRGTPAPGRYQ